MLFVGNDWAEAHHDVEIVDPEGRVLVRRRLAEGVAGLAELHGLVADHLGEDDEPDQVLVGIETDRGPWPQALIAAGYTVYPINPRQVARYRERHGTAGGKSDPGDAHVLAEIVRLDRAHHRPAAGDSDVGRGGQARRPRAPDDDLDPAALDVTRCAPCCGSSTPPRWPPSTTSPTGTRWPCWPSRRPRRRPPAYPGPGREGAAQGGRRRYVAARAAEIVAGLRAEQLSARAGLVPAYAASVSALVAVITTMVEQTPALEEQVTRVLASTRTLRST